MNKEEAKKELSRRAREELAERLRDDEEFRTKSGMIYYIKDKEGKVTPYKPNKYQMSLKKDQHSRNIILKARQLGFSTEIDIQALDFALTHDNVNVGIIAQDKDKATDIFRDKVKVAFDNLPDNIKNKYKTETNRAGELSFSNGSRISVGTSYRSGTLQFLHISEFGKICAKFPEKAREIVTGAMEALGKNGLLFIESTAEGNEGYFYNYFSEAIKYIEYKESLTLLDLKPFFFARWENDDYILEDKNILLTKEDDNYFAMLNATHQIQLRTNQKKWYANKKSKLQDDMGREYPSFRQEAFDLAIQGAYYETQMNLARKQERIGEFPYNPSMPVYCVRDLGGFGGGDEMALIFYQKNGERIDVIDYEEETGYSLEEFQTNFVSNKPYKILEDWFPHDAKRTESNGKTVANNARELGIPVMQLSIGGIANGINEVKRLFYRVRFNEKNTHKLVKALSNYRRLRDEKRGMFQNTPYHNKYSHGADAFRYLAVSFQERAVKKPKQKRKVFNVLLGEYTYI